VKIGILTQPLHTNYGGLLQSFALQTVLKKMGHEVWTIDRPGRKSTLIVKSLSIIKRFLVKTIYHKSIIIRIWPTSKEKKVINKYMNNFIKENIRTTLKIDSVVKLSLLKKYQFDAYIVGSDQVWRPKYSPCITNYFLDFLDGVDKVKRIAYAASFGVENWEFTNKQTNQCASLAKRFDKISVREDSAITLCKKYLGVDAIHVLDPTMLLAKEDYMKLIEKSNIPYSEGFLMTFILDRSYEKDKIIKKAIKELNLNPFSVTPRNLFSEVGGNRIEDCIFPSVNEWIKGFIKADYVITDSFHGTVFSIIFNKPFISIGNSNRGMTRFTSLLKMFGLEERIIQSIDDLTLEKLQKPINFEYVNKTLKENQKRSFMFLINSLKN